MYKCRHAYAHMCIYVHIYTWPGGLVCICINSIWILKLKVYINFISQCQLKCLFYGKRMMLAPDQGPSASSWEPLTFQRSLQRCYLKKKNRKSPVLREIKRSGPTAEGTDSLGEEKGKKKKQSRSRRLNRERGMSEPKLYAISWKTPVKPQRIQEAVSNPRNRKAFGCLLFFQRCFYYLLGFISIQYKAKMTFSSAKLSCTLACHTHEMPREANLRNGKLG